MVDKVRPLKIENPDQGGIQTDYYPTEVDPIEDYLSAVGIAFEELDEFLIEKIGKVITERFPTEYQQVSFNLENDIDFVEYFDNSSFVTANRIAKRQVNYDLNLNPSSETILIFGNDGSTILRTVTFTYTYSGDDAVSAQITMS